MKNENSNAVVCRGKCWFLRKTDKKDTHETYALCGHEKKKPRAKFTHSFLFLTVSFEWLNGVHQNALYLMSISFELNWRCFPFEINIFSLRSSSHLPSYAIRNSGETVRVLRGLENMLRTNSNLVV